MDTSLNYLLRRGVAELDGEGEVALHTLQQAMNEWRSNLEVFPPELVDDRVRQDPDVIRRLQGLGYIA